ncbi:MAG: universal stress protein [Chloroflexi bacterium]|nr:universal stress protein [Chloroflexota bacterium]
MSASTTCAGAARPATTDDHFYRVLVVLDDATTAQALVAAASVANRDGSDLALLATVDAAGAPADGAGARRAARARVLAASLSLPPDVHPDEFVVDGPPAAAIARVARDWEADLVVSANAALLDSLGCHILLVAAMPGDAGTTERLLRPAGHTRALVT